MNKTEKFYKLAKLDGFDFYTGKTINYRENIGKTVKCPQFNVAGDLCSDAFIHASRKPNDCFVGARIPCSAYRVSGKSIKEDKVKCGFEELAIIEELNPKTVFQWNYKEACNPINPFKILPPNKITKKHIQLTEKWASVGDLVGLRASVWASVGDLVGLRASVWASVRDLVGLRASVWASTGLGDSVRDSVWAYIGSIFISEVPAWKKEYPYQCAVDLWKMGLVPSFDGKKWRLHGGSTAEILWEGTLKAAKQLKKEGDQ